jgi:hypothetical protein
MKNSEIDVKPTSGAGPRRSEGPRKDTVSAATPTARKTEASLSIANFPRRPSCVSKGHARTRRRHLLGISAGGGPANDSIGCDLDRSPDPSLRSGSRSARLDLQRRRSLCDRRCKFSKPGSGNPETSRAANQDRNSSLEALQQKQRKATSSCRALGDGRPSFLELEPWMPPARRKRRPRPVNCLAIQVRVSAPRFVSACVTRCSSLSARRFAAAIEGVRC